MWSIIISLVGKALGEHMDIWNGWTIGQLTSIHIFARQSKQLSWVNDSRAHIKL